MKSRMHILEAIKINQPQYVELPSVDLDLIIQYNNPVQQFKLMLEGIGGKVEAVNNLQELKGQLTVQKAAGKFVLNAIDALGKTDQQVAFFSAAQLEKLETVYIRGTVAVSENGAVWIDGSDMINRLLPFICEHLVLIIEKNSIVATMHEAYKKIYLPKEGFGVFIAGPSKTADIEQSLVIGAHGARTITVYIVESLLHDPEISG